MNKKWGKRVKYECAVCEKETERLWSRYKESRTHFCSRKCHIAFIRTTPEQKKEWWKRYYRDNEKYREQAILRAKDQRENPLKSVQYKEWQSDFLQKRRLFLASHKNIPCVRCKKKYPPAAMDFHHRNPSEKTFTITTANRYKLEAILAEIKKCDVLCANCHRIIEDEKREIKRNESKLARNRKISK